MTRFGAFNPGDSPSFGHKGRRQAWYEDMGVKLSEADSFELVRSHEYASAIMEAVKTGVPIRFNGNLLNNNHITNLPNDCCVEVPCLVDNLGIHPCTVGDLPQQCAALNRLNINVQELTAEAVMNRDKHTAFQALLCDPSVMATCSISKAREMFEEMWDAEGDLLEAYGREAVTV